MFMRIFLFICTNIAIMVMVSIICAIFGVGDYMTASGMDYSALMVFCLIWGMVGSFISLQMSRWIAKRSLGVQLITTETAGQYHWVVEMVTRLAKQAELPNTPEIGIFQQNEPNAFATGPSKSRSLVALSTGIIESMPREEIEAVVGHEIAHIKNGDMVTMTLIQGVVNAFVMFFSRIAAYAISQAVDEKYERMVYFITVIAAQIIFGILGSVVTCWFSRKREFRADEGGAALTSKRAMANALASLQRRVNQSEGLPEGMAAFGISSKPQTSLMQLLSTHPPLGERIKALQA